MGSNKVRRGVDELTFVNGVMFTNKKVTNILIAKALYLSKNEVMQLKHVYCINIYSKNRCKRRVLNYF